MSFDPESKIKNSEILFRAFHYDQWDYLKDRVSSSVFKSSNSISVDRDGERVEKDIISAFRTRKNYESCGLVKNLAQFYLEINCTLKPDKLPDNIYHALVDKLNGIGTTNSIARKLAKDSNLVIMAELK